MTIARDLSKILDANGDLTIDTNTLFVDSSTNSVGIGTSSPVGKLDVRGEQDFVNQNGVNDSGAINAVSDIDTNNGSDAVASLAFKAPYSTGNSDRVVYGAITGHKDNSVQGQRHGNLRFYTNSSSAVTERMRITSSGNVGIGTSSPAFSSGYGGLHISSTYPELRMTGTNSGHTNTDGFKIQYNSSNQALLWNYENASVSIGTNNTTRMTIDSSGDVRVFNDLAVDGVLRIKGTEPDDVGRLLVSVNDTEVVFQGNESSAQTDKKFIFSGGNQGNDKIVTLRNGGINFGSDTADANLLNDYEEGTWTPTASQGTVVVSNAKYTKVGRLVTVYATNLGFSDITTNAPIEVGGLPFLSDGDQATGSAMWSFADTANRHGATYISTSSKIQFYDASRTGGYDVMDHNMLNNSLNKVYFIATYFSA